MPAIDRTWSVETVKAVSIWIPRGEIHVYGTDENQIRLQVDPGEWNPEAIQPVLSGEWLVINAWDDRNPSFDLSLGLPKSQAWVVELSTGNGDIEIHDLQARLQVATGRGDVRLAHCQGFVSVRSGNGDIEIEDWTERTMPERPAPPTEAETTPPPFKETANFNVPGPKDWFDWGPQEWNAWGLQFGEQARRWAHQFRHFWDNLGWPPTKPGINVHTGHGDVSLTNIEATNCSIASGKGDHQLKDGWVANLALRTAHGDVQVAGVLPTEKWSLKSTFGDINLTLPANAQGRLDAATRRGDLNSEVPLVRVARPGPESHGGGRMVGTLGSAEGARAQIELVTQHGDVTIQLGPASRRTPAAASQPVEAASTGAPMPQTEPPVGEANVTSQGMASQEIEEANPAAGEDYIQPGAQVASNPPTEDPAMAILQALQDGSITVEEADRLLQSRHIRVGPTASD